MVYYAPRDEKGKPMKASVFPPFENHNGTLSLDGVNVIDLGRRFGTPLIIVSERKIRENYRNIHGAFSRRYGNFSIRFAVKAYPNLAVISLLRQEGSGADVSTLEELKMATASDIDPRDITFTPNNASAEDLKTGSATGAMVNFDDISQMKLVGDTLPEVVSFRVNPGIGGGEFQGIVTAGPGTKFGIPASVAQSAYREAMSLGARKFGMQMMAGSNVLDWKHFDSISRVFFELAGELHKELGIEFEYLDIGGGFGVPYKPGQNPLDIDSVAEIVVSNLKEACSRHGMKEPQLIVEPGRYLVADSAIILGKVNNVKSYDRNFVGTDIGMNILIRPALYGAYHHIVVANRLDDDVSTKADVVGQICESTDRIGIDISLPDVDPGDFIAVFNCGAYVSGMSSNYNGHLRPTEVMVNDSSVDVIRKGEDFSDLIRGMAVPDRLLK